MARYLAIDWTTPTLRVLAVSTSRGKGHVESSFSSEPAGLEEALRKANVSPAPVVAAIGRDKVILKEVTIPVVPAHEEPAIVRFQVAKELTDATADVILDYNPLGPAKAGQPRRIQVAIVRKAIVREVTQACQSAGLRQRHPPPALRSRRSSRPQGPRDASDDARPHRAVGRRRGRLLRLLGQRTRLGANAVAGWGSTSEIQRNLMLLAAQKPDLPPLQRIETANLAELGTIPVEKDSLEPWRDGDKRPDDPNPYLGALGLAETLARGLPLNLAAPKEPKPVTDSSQRRKRMLVIVASLLVPALLLGYWINLSSKRSAATKLQAEKERLDEEWKLRDQDRLDIAAIKEWRETSISWLDELYDIAARLPHQQGLRITQVAAAPLPRKSANDKYTGRITLHGIMSGDQDVSVTQFLEAVHKDPYLKAQSPTFKANEFTVKIDVAPRPSGKYDAALVVPPQPKRAPEPKVEEPTDE